MDISALGVSGALVRVGVIVILAWLLHGLGRKLIRIFRAYMSSRAVSQGDARRIDTLARVFHHIFTVVISLVTGMLALSEVGISIAPILGAAGVVGLAVGFGAQSLIKDYFNGFFMLLENQIRQGDEIEVCGKTGTVEDVNLRYVCLRDGEGCVHYVPNGQITTVTNRSRDYGFALIDVRVSHRANPDEVYAAVREAGGALRADAATGPKILGDIEILGVQELTDTALVLRCRFKTAALEQGNVRRAFLGQIKRVFDARGIEIPCPPLPVYASQNKERQRP